MTRPPTEAALHQQQPISRFRKDAIDKRFADRDSMYLAAMGAVHLKHHGPMRAQTLHVCLDAGGGSLIGFWASEEKRSHD
jgi:hypothetical protein